MWTKWIIACVVIVFAAAATTTPSHDTEPDPYLWLEEVHGARVDEWVSSENKKTLHVLQRDSRYKKYLHDAVKIADAKDKIPFPYFMAGKLYNFWQDSNHVHGVWRRTTLKEYRKPNPRWETVLDLDRLSRNEKINWVWQGANCDEPAQQRCMISLSDGGEDAATIREFDLTTRRFVLDGFAFPRGKANVVWRDRDTLIAVYPSSPDEVTMSGYPFVAKVLKRGQPLSTAIELFRGNKTDTSVRVWEAHDGDGHYAFLVSRSLSFFEDEYRLITDQGVFLLSLPKKSTLTGYVANQLIFEIDDQWDIDGKHIKAGSLVSLGYLHATKDPVNLHPEVIYTPGDHEYVEACDVTGHSIVVTALNNVRGRVYIYQRNPDGKWLHQQLTLADNSAINLIATDDRSEQAFLQVSNMLQAPQLLLINGVTGSIERVKQLPDRFDSSNLVVEQLSAKSTDGTAIPYFIAHPKHMKYDAQLPTIIYGYGGFTVNVLPDYSSNVGKLWLEKGGAFVYANIRGGGEFGPAWHEAGLKTKRQIIYDDFEAVARDLIARGITSPRRLGMMGGSNGGLLMGVEFVQHPELWNAVDIQIPLLDMMRYEQIAAGASWVGEYGTVSNPDERAFLSSISPYKNLKKGVAYPEPLVWTTTKDDRVGPQHARKFAARLSEFGIPYLFYEVPEGGHGSGSNLHEDAMMDALEFTYFARKLMN